MMSGQRHRTHARLLAYFAIALILAACGNSAKSTGSPTSSVSPASSDQARGEPTPSAGELTPTVEPANACPADGCRVRITSVTKAGAELRITLTANYAPDVSRNHFHIYWDIFTSRQVSDDAVPRFQVKQGSWVPTADNPYITGAAASVTKRTGSTRVCVTAADRYHDVLDPTLYNCYDVASLL